MRLGERATMFVVRKLGTWSNVWAQLVVWTSLYLIYEAHGWRLDGINYALSEWPVLVDMLILSATLVLTDQQITSADRQNRMIDAVSGLTEGITASLAKVAADTAALTREVAEMRKYARLDAQDIDEILVFVREARMRSQGDDQHDGAR